MSVLYFVKKLTPAMHEWSYTFEFCENCHTVSNEEKKSNCNLHKASLLKQQKYFHDSIIILYDFFFLLISSNAHMLINPCSLRKPLCHPFCHNCTLNTLLLPLLYPVIKTWGPCLDYRVLSGALWEVQQSIMGTWRPFCNFLTFWWGTKESFTSCCAAL